MGKTRRLTFLGYSGYGGALARREAPGNSDNVVFLVGEEDLSAQGPGIAGR